MKSPSFGFDFRAAPRPGYKFLPTKFFSQVLQTFLCNMAPVVQLQCQILVSRAPAPSTAAARSTEAPEMPWQRWIGSIHRPKVTTSWRQELNIFYGFNLVSSKKSLIQSTKYTRVHSHTHTQFITILDTKVIITLPHRWKYLFKRKRKKNLILISIGSSFKLALQVHGVFQAGDGELQCLDVWQLPILR